MRTLIFLLLTSILVSCSKSKESSKAEKINDNGIQIVFPKNGATYKGGETFCYRADFSAQTIKAVSARLTRIDNPTTYIDIENTPNISRFTINEEWIIPKQLEGKLRLEFTLTDEKGNFSQSSVNVRVESVE